MAAWDAEVGDAPVIEDVALWGPLEGFLVFEDALLGPLMRLSKAMELHRGVGFAVGDSGEESRSRLSEGALRRGRRCGEDCLSRPRRMAGVLESLDRDWKEGAEDRRQDI